MKARSSASFSITLGALLVAQATACGGDSPTADTGSGGSGGVSASSASSTSSPHSTSATSTGGLACAPVAGSPIAIATAGAAGEAVLTVRAASADDADWSTKGREAVVLEITRGSVLVGHLVLHEGARPHEYAMTLGELAAGDVIEARVSPLSAADLAPSACIESAVITPVAALPDPEGALRAPVFAWPVEKRFDDLPLLVGWSAAKRKYEAVFTNENGGTPVLCGGGAKGLAAEIAQWGRALDIEAVLELPSADFKWKRCTGATTYGEHAPRLEGAHPVLYYGDGHNGLFESRGGYGKACGTSGDDKADGDLDGWNVGNPGSDAANDAPYVIVLRPVPVSLDALGYAVSSGRREALVDAYAPELYRVAGDEVAREGKVDGSNVFPWTQYAYVDVRMADVGGKTSCTTATSGFKIRLEHANGSVVEGPQVTASSMSTGEAWKRVAVPLPLPVAAADIAAVQIDAYDGDGMYWLELGDVFVPTQAADGTVKLDYAHQGASPVGVYVDDDSSGCQGGENSGGPGGAPLPCAGSSFTVKL